MDFDKKYIKIAIFNLNLVKGRSFPNPTVVSILVETSKGYRDDKIVNFGFTCFSGRPHAESQALKNVKFKKDKNYILYSTLEPCCHIGRSESCVSKILKSKVRRVVFSSKDFDKRVNGRGNLELKKKGIKVINGIFKKETDYFYKGYFLNRRIQRPKIILKMATSLNGMITNKFNQNMKITNKEIDRYNHIMRSQVDAILIGGNTLRIDNCLLTCRLPGLAIYSPLRVILSNKLNFKENLKIFKTAKKVKTVIFTQNNFFSKKQFNSVEIIKISDKKKFLENVLKKLAEMGVSDLVVEGGSTIFSLFLKKELFDEIYLIKSNFFIESSGTNMINEKKMDLSKLKLKTKFINRFGENYIHVLEKSDKTLV